VKFQFLSRDIAFNTQLSQRRRWPGRLSIAIVMGWRRARGASRCNIPVALSAELAEWV